MSDQPSPKRQRSEEPEEPSTTQQAVEQEQENDNDYTQEELDKGFELIKAVIAGDLVGTTCMVVHDTWSDAIG